MAEQTSVAGPAGAGKASMSERPSDTPTQSAAPGEEMEHPNQAIIREIRRRMGNHAHLLRYLPIDQVLIEDDLSDEEQPTSTVPHHIYFGEIGELSETPGSVHIFLRIGPTGGPPELRYHVCSRDGVMSTNSVKAARLCQHAVPTAAFQCIKEGSGIGELKVRALARYYFLAREVDLKTMWPINDKFIQELISACQVAELNSAAPGDMGHTKARVATQATRSRAQHQPLPSILQQVHHMRPHEGSSHQGRPKDTYEDIWMKSIPLDKGRKSRYSEPNVNGQPAEERGPDRESMRIHGSAQQAAPLVGGNGHFGRRAFPQPRGTQRVRSTFAPGRHGANETINDALVARASSASTAPTRNILPTQDDAVATKNFADFIASHDKISDDVERCDSDIQKNKIEQSKRQEKKAAIQVEAEMVKNKLDAIQAREEVVDDELAALQAEEEQFKNKRKRVCNEQKRLHDSLPGYMREVLNYGRRLGKTEKNKRVKLNQDDVSDEDDA